LFIIFVTCPTIFGTIREKCDFLASCVLSFCFFMEHRLADYKSTLQKVSTNFLPSQIDICNRKTANRQSHGQFFFTSHLLGGLQDRSMHKQSNTLYRPPFGDNQAIRSKNVLIKKYHELSFH